MSKLKDSCCIICNKNITNCSTISIRDYMRPLSNPQLSLYTFFQLISNFNLLDISEVPQYACDKCYQDALHVLDYQTLCNKAVENIKAISEDIEHVCVGNDCDDDILYLPEEDTEVGYGVVEIITKNPDNAKDENIASLPTPLYLSEEDTADGYDVVEIITENPDNANDKDIASLPAPLCLPEEYSEDGYDVAELSTKHLDNAIDEDTSSLPATVTTNRKRNDVNRAERVECEHCHKLYRRDYMHIHNRIHTGERPFKCKLCPEDFKSTSALKFHMLIHYGGTYKCTVCGAAFRRKPALDCHMMVHTGARPYKCEICGKTFRSKTTHDEHYSLHSNTKPSICPECPKIFSTNKLLKRHMVTIHAKNKLIECTFCGKQFPQKVLQKHQANRCQGSGNNEASLV